jgi:Protein of unknown function (DUF2971)
MAIVRNPIQPKHLYRYRSINSEERMDRELDSLRDHTLLGSHFERLNDPMEGTYRAGSHLTKHRNYAAIRSHIFDEKAALGVCSFSETNDNPIMWAHYADQFAGICIQYDFGRLLSIDNVQFARVSYSENAQEISLNNLQDVDLAKNILSTKGHTWLYEREWRMLSPHSGHPVAARINCISGIYLGNRIHEDKQDEIKAAVGRKKIPIYKMKLDGYSIKFEEPAN